MEQVNSVEQPLLSIIITTYNRELPLMEQLRSIECQGYFEGYKIYVVDNCSNYDVTKSLRKHFDEPFLSRIELIKRPYNIGGDLNILLSFQIPDTSWMWLLSDDDITSPGSLEQILNDIDDHNDDNICWLKYSIEGFRSFVPCTINTVLDFFKYFTTNSFSGGEMIFMSNNVYKLEPIRKWITESAIWNGTAMEQIVLPLLAIKYGNEKMMFIDKPVTNYVANRTSYSGCFCHLKFGQIIYGALKFNKNELKAFRKINFDSLNDRIKALANIDDRALRNEYFKKILISFYPLISFDSLKFFFLKTAIDLLGCKRFKRLIEFRSGYDNNV